MDFWESNVKRGLNWKWALLRSVIFLNPAGATLSLSIQSINEWTNQSLNPCENVPLCLSLDRLLYFNVFLPSLILSMQTEEKRRDAHKPSPRCNQWWFHRRASIRLPKQRQALVLHCPSYGKGSPTRNTVSWLLSELCLPSLFLLHILS